MNKFWPRIILITFLGLPGCTSRSFFPPWFGSLGANEQIKSVQAKLPNRKIAQNIQAPSRKRSCKADFSKTARVTRQLIELEDKLGPAKFSADFNGLQLKSASLGEWSFLDHVKRIHRDHIRSGSGSLDQQSWVIDPDANIKGCLNLVCILNRVYGKPDDDLAGKMIYSFFLQTGYLLNSSDQILDYTESSYSDYDPKQPGSATISLADALFSEKELSAFFDLGQVLPPTLKNLPSVVTLYRMPRKKSIPGVGAPACGISRGSWITYSYSDRSVVRMVPLDIQLTDACLRIDDSKPLNGFFFDAIVHEFAHHFDYSSMQPTGKRFSDSSLWLNESEWIIETGIEKNEKGEDVPYRQWKSHDQAEFVSDYAMTNPTEDFAETASKLRFEPVQAEKLAPKKVKIVQDAVFDQRSFTESGLVEHYTKQVSIHLVGQILQLLDQCRESSSLMACVQSESEKMIEQSLDDLALAEFEACQILANQTHVQAITVAAQNHVSSYLNSIQTQNASASETAEKIRKYRIHLAQSFEPREAAFSCAKDQDPKTCYQQRSDKAFYQVIHRTAEPWVSLEKEYFDRSREYRIAQAEVNAYFRWVLLGSSRMTERTAESKIQACVETWEKGGKSRSMTPSSSGRAWNVHPYSGPGLTLPGEVLDCINRNYDQLISGFLVQWADEHPELKLGSANSEIKKEAEVLLGMDFQSSLDALMKNRAAEERVRWNQMESPLKDEVKKKLLSDPSWANEKIESKSLTSACFEATLPIWKQWIGKDMPTLTESEGQYRSKWMGPLCKEVIETETIKKAQRQASWDSALKVAEKHAKKFAEESYLTCKKLHPLSKKNRIYCIDFNWETVVSKTVKQWKKDPTASAYVSREAEVTSHLKSSKVQNRILGPYKL